MTKLLSFTSPQKLVVGKALELSQVRPKEIMALGRKNIVFSKFDDWLLAARKANSISPYALFWREIALQYPVADVIINLNNLLKVAGEEPDLADQVQAIVLLVPVKKLPAVKQLRQLPSASPEQAHIRTALVRKKILGEENFLRTRFFQAISSAGEGLVSFTLIGGQNITRASAVFQDKTWKVRKHRIKTVYGLATVVPVNLKTEGVNPIFLLVDGDFRVRKFYPAELQRISLEK